MKVRIGVAGALFLSLGALFAGSLPAFGQTGGTVPVTVSVPAAVCMNVSTTQINYGSAPFSTTTLSTKPGTFGGATSCSTAPQELLVAGTNATGGGGAVTWTLSGTGSCPTMGTNVYKHAIDDPDAADLQMTTTPQLLTTIAAMASTGPLATTFIMPCTGSSGAGLTMSASINFTAQFVP